MGSNKPVLTPDQTNSSDEDSLRHVVCECTPDRSLCGRTVTIGPLDPDDSPATPNDCIVCEDLNEYHCPRCGF